LHAECRGTACHDESASPRGRFCFGAALQWEDPHAAPPACCPPRGHFCFGAAQQQKIHHPFDFRHGMTICGWNRHDLCILQPYDAAIAFPSFLMADGRLVRIAAHESVVFMFYLFDNFRNF
jgi:hypothetical protein